MIKGQRGVTLLELMVAVVITSLMGLAIAVTFKQAANAWQKGEARSQRYQNARTGLDRMSEEIKSALRYTTGNDGAGNQGTELVGTNNGTEDYLTVITCIPNSGDSIVQRISYYINSTNEELYRSNEIENKLIATSEFDDTIPVTSGGSQLALHATGLNITYYDSVGASSDSWNSDTNTALPTRMKIELTVKDDVAGHQKSETISTVIHLPQS